MAARFWIPGYLVACSIAVGLSFAFRLEWPGRTLLAIAFLATCPGLGLVHCLGLHRTAAVWVLTLVLSLALDTVVAGVMLYTGTWSVPGTLIILIWISLVGAIARATRTG
jgi:hypothetical protein